jgi:hypothetical protein
MTQTLDPCGGMGRAYNAAMRVSLTARFVSHPPIHFGRGRHLAARRRLGLSGGTTVYHRPLRRRRALLTVEALRAQTSLFRFPSVGRVGRVRTRRAVPPLGLPRARRA